MKNIKYKNLKVWEHTKDKAILAAAYKKVSAVQMLDDIISSELKKEESKRRNEKIL